jgi:hypothetical protein
VKEGSLSVHKQAEAAAVTAASKLTGKIVPAVGAILGDCSAFLFGDCSAFLGDCCSEPASAGGGGDRRPEVGACSIDTNLVLHFIAPPEEQEVF